MKTYTIDFPKSLSNEEEKSLNTSLNKLINDYFLIMKSYTLNKKRLVLECDEQLFSYINNTLKFLNII